MAKKDEKFVRRRVGRPRASDPVSADERIEIEGRRSFQFGNLLAAKVQPATRSRGLSTKPPAGGMLPAEGDEDRAGIAVRPGAEAKPLAKTPKPRKRLKHRSRVRLDPVDLQAAMVQPWRLRAAARAAGARRTARPVGWTRLDQFLASLAAATPDPEVWLTVGEMVQILDGILPRDDIKWLYVRAVRKGVMERLEVVDAIRARVDLTPGRHIPKALYRLTRAGRALVMALG